MGHPTTDAETVLACLENDTCRTLLSETADEALTAKELCRRSGQAPSTVYRKLEELTDAGFLHESTRISPAGKHASEYQLAVEQITITLGDGLSTDVEVADEFDTQSAYVPLRPIAGD